VKRNCRICYWHSPPRSVCRIADVVFDHEGPTAEADPLETFWCSRFVASEETIRQELKALADPNAET
jgi:hypothetical protein